VRRKTRVRDHATCARRKKSAIYILLFLGAWCTALGASPAFAEEAQAAPSPDSSLTLELQGVNILDVFKILSNWPFAHFDYETRFNSQ